MTVRDVIDLATVALPALSLAFTVYLLVKHGGTAPVPLTPNERLMAAALRAATGAFAEVRANGAITLSGPGAIGATISKTAEVLQKSWAETAAAAGATPEDLERIAKTATMEALKGLPAALR